MEISFFDFDEAKRKFGSLLSLLYHNAGIRLENINNMLIFSSYLDLFEKGRIEEFMNTSNEDIALTLFKDALLFSDGHKDIGDIYWCGIQYMNIFFNYQIPLRTLFVLCPLDEMVKKYTIYHEMNEIELCKDFMKNEYINNSILKYFRKNKNLSIADLSFLSGVSNPTIRYFEQDNTRLYKAPHAVLNSLEGVLEVPQTILKEKSDFLALTPDLIHNDDFLFIVKEVFNAYLNKTIDNLIIVYSNKEITDDGDYLILADNLLKMHDGKIIAINESVSKQLISISIERYINKYLTTTLVL